MSSAAASLTRPLRVVLIGYGPVGARFVEELLPTVAAGRAELTVVGADVLQQCAQLAAQEGVDARRAHRHRPVGIGDRALV